MLRRVGVSALLLAAGVVALPATPAAAATVVPLADSYVDATAPDSNFGTNPALRVDSDPALTAYVKFDVTGFVPGNTTALRVYADSAGASGVTVRSVADTTWSETAITANTAPPVGAVLGTSSSLAAGSWATVDVSSAVTGDGPVSFAITTSGASAIRLSSKEGANAPYLMSPAPPGPSPYVVSAVGSEYQAVSATTGTTFAGTLKSVVERAIADLGAKGGTVRFTAGTFDLGTDYFLLKGIANVVFEGAGMDSTVIRNATDAAADTEPFNFAGASKVTIRDLTVAAGGAARTTSDAIDFDNGSDNLVERVKITASRSRGIVFDGKNTGFAAERNTVRDCVIDGTTGDGIELLAASSNTVTGCRITNVGGNGIQVVKASPVADQPNKKASDNTIADNTIDESAHNGIEVLSGDRNRITGNRVSNSADATSSRDGIRVSSTDGITCDDNVVTGNTSTDTQPVHTQEYGLNIPSALCRRTVVGGNTFAGNVDAGIFDAGTDTVAAGLPPGPRYGTQPRDTWTVTGGQVNAMVRVGSGIVLGGTFTGLRSPTGATVARSRLALVDANTGAPVTTWNAPANGEVNALATDGTRVFVGGAFTTIGGVARTRFASVSASTGAVNTGFVATANGVVRGLLVVNGKLYAGGLFTSINGAARMRLAAVSPVSGAVDAVWRPTSNWTVNGLVVIPGTTQIAIGGNFATISGQPRRYLASVHRDTGALSAWAPQPVVGMCDDPAHPCIARGIAANAEHVFAAIGGPGGTVAAYAVSNGERTWMQHGDGDVQCIAVIGDTVYGGGHFAPAFGPQAVPADARYQVAAMNAATGRILPFAPRVTGGLGVWSMLAEPDGLRIGGAFNRINNDATIVGFGSFPVS